MTPGQERALWQLREIAAVDNHSLEIESVKEPSTDDSFLSVRINLHVGYIEHAKGGVRLRDRETFYLVIPPRFPFQKAEVWVDHQRFAGKPHVQWVRYLCLYQSPTEWNPSDGVFGLITRLHYWLKQGALDQLDPPGQALHPPAVYTDIEEGKFIIPRANTPHFEAPFWIGLARISDHAKFVEITAWFEVENAPHEGEYAVAILFGAPLPWEYPANGDALFRECSRQGVSADLLFRVLKFSSLLRPEGSPIYLILGSPMRGISAGERAQHLSVWAIDGKSADFIRTTVSKASDSETVSELRAKLEESLKEVLRLCKISWCPILEDRTEVTVRRDYSSALSYFRAKSVSIWGCGALGGYIANYVCRAGISKLMLRDRGIVTPGILVRQPYLAEDIGETKVDALRRQLLAIRPELEVHVNHSDLERELSVPGFNWSDGADIVIDATASDLVRRRLEIIWNHTKRVPTASLMIDQTANHLIVALAGAEYTGGVWQVWRETKLELLRNPDLDTIADCFFPAEIRAKAFQPEPGCSEPTFVGSSADSAGLAAIGLNLIAAELTKHPFKLAVSHLFTHPDNQTRLRMNSLRFQFEREMVVYPGDQEVRISPHALREMKAWISQHKRVRSELKETGGLLWGEWDDSTGVVWVTDVSGPPPDSEHHEDLFVCGVEGTADEHKRRSKQSRLSVGYIGMWHTHPISRPFPSQIDIAGMHKILTSGVVPPRKNLLLILGKQQGRDTLGAFLFRRVTGDEFSAIHELKQGRSPLPEGFL